MVGWYFSFLGWVSFFLATLSTNIQLWDDCILVPARPDASEALNTLILLPKPIWLCRASFYGYLTFDAELVACGGQPPEHQLYIYSSDEVYE